MKYINLKLHSEYSLLEGVGSLKEYVERAKDFGQEVLGITDTSLFALVKFYDISPCISFSYLIFRVLLSRFFPNKYINLVIAASLVRSFPLITPIFSK